MSNPVCCHGLGTGAGAQQGVMLAKPDDALFRPRIAATWSPE